MLGVTDPWREDELVLRLGVWPKTVYDEQMRRSVKKKKYNSCSSPSFYP